MLKSALFTVSLLSLSASAFAWPGTRSVSCKSLPGAKKTISLGVSITGTPTPDMPASASLSINGASFSNDDPDRTALSIIFQPSDHVITTAFNERDEKHVINLELWAKPATIKGRLDKQNCVAQYTFRASLNGEVFLSGDRPENEKNEYAEGEAVQCEYHETFGSAGC